MWIFATDGFFSAVADRECPGGVVVRARVREDAELLAASVGGLEVLATPNRDYPFRVHMPAETWAGFVARQAAAIDYPNFKSAVGQRQGGDRARVYGRVWSVLLSLQRRPRR